MTTAVGQIAYDFSATANQNPWALADGGGGDPFAVRNGMTAKIDSNALKSDYNNNGFVCYVAQAVDQAAFEVKGETLKSSGSFGDQVGVGSISSTGNGYIVYINGSQLRFYKVTAFALSQLDSTETTAHSALDVISLEYAFSAGTVTLNFKLNGSTTVSRTDTTSVYNGDQQPCWYFNFDDSNTGGFRSIAIDGIAASVTIDTYPATVRSGSTGNAYTTTGLSSVSSITIGSLVGTSISDTTGDGTHSVPSLVDGVAHELYGTKTVTITGTGGAPTTTTNFQPATGNEFVTLSGTLNTSNTGGLYNFSPAAVVTDQIVFPDTANFNYDAQGNITGEAGTYNCWHIQASTKIARSYTVTLGSGGSESNQNGVIILGIINDGVIL